MFSLWIYQGENQMSNTIQPGIYKAECSGTDKPLKGLMVKYKAGLTGYMIYEIEKFGDIKIHPLDFWQESKVRRWIEKHKATMVF